MIADVRTVMWKEWAEFVRQRSTVIGMVMFLGVMGVFVPLQRGPQWIDSRMPLINSIVLPLMLVLGIVADSFAGERERHTLETLLATRLSERAIVLGKFIAVIAYGWGLALAGLALGLITANASGGGENLRFFPAGVVVAGVVFGLLGAGLSAGAGILVSQRAATVRQAAQMISVGMMGLTFIAVTGLTTLPRGWKQAIFETAGAIPPGERVLIAALLLAAIDIALLSIAWMRFQRSNLILD
jgi:ABC-2 type transport system permease protein